MPVPNAPAPVITDIGYDEITVDLGTSNSEYSRDIGQSSTDPGGGDPDQIVDTIPGTQTTYTYTGLTPDTTYWLGQRFIVT